MELLEIRSPCDLTTRPPQTRTPVAHSYLMICNQFTYVLANWHKPTADRGPTAQRGFAPSFMTLAAEELWLTEEEIVKIVVAIESDHSQVLLN
jgi:hypothetical protein